jgi:hypothetical protein
MTKLEIRYYVLRYKYKNWKKELKLKREAKAFVRDRITTAIGADWFHFTIENKAFFERLESYGLFEKFMIVKTDGGTYQIYFR